MFNNIIYFIIVLLIFSISYPEKAQEGSYLYNLIMPILFWFIFAGYCRVGFQRLLNRDRGNPNSRLTNEYHSLFFRLSILAIFLFSLDVYIFHLKYWLQSIPGVKQFSVLQGGIALALFFFYLATIWYFSHPVYRMAFQVDIKRRSLIISNLRFNAPILFPWFTLSLIYDLISLSPWAGPEKLLGRPEGQMGFFIIFLGILFVFMPPAVQYLWGCRPFTPSSRIDELKDFLRQMGFKYRAIMRWPIFEGRMMTAGIMGIVPRYRYILLTDSLVEILTVKELKAVIAHEVGHSRYKHLFYYMFFFVGYMLLAFGSFDLFFNLIASHPYFMKVLGEGEESSVNFFYIVLSFPIILTMFIYFRYIMGFFMRNFERQADLYSAMVMESPAPTISALEKIALLSGKSRDLPSWHHFSIKERVDCLWKMLRTPGLIKQHNRYVGLSLVICLIGIAGLGYLLNFSPIKQGLNNSLVAKVLNRQLMENPDNVALLQSLALFYQKTEKYGKAIETYERLLRLNPSQAVALNNLAWLLVTAPERELRDPKRGLMLAEEAVAVERIPTFLDTLAEALYVNGFVDRAIEIIKEAIYLEKGDNTYYKGQLRKFMGRLKSR